MSGETLVGVERNMIGHFPPLKMWSKILYHRKRAAALRKFEQVRRPRTVKALEEVEKRLFDEYVGEWARYQPPLNRAGHVLQGMAWRGYVLRFVKLDVGVLPLEPFLSAHNPAEMIAHAALMALMLEAGEADV